MSDGNVLTKIFDLRDECIAYVAKHFPNMKGNAETKEIYLINQFYQKHNIKLNINYLKDILAPIFHGEIRELIQNNEMSDRKEKQRQEDFEKQYTFSKAREDLLNKVLKNKTKTSFKQACELKSFQNLKDEDKRKIYDEYEKQWEQEHQEKVPKQIVDTFMDKLNNFVVTHADDLLTFEEFKQITSMWNRGRKTIDEWYEIYKSKFFKQPGTTVSYKEESLMTFKPGFKGNNKYEFSTNEKPLETNFTNYFPLKQNQKLYQLHKVASKGTYLIDLMFVDKLTYLVAINVNTRYLYVELTNIITENGEFATDDKKNSLSYLRALQKMIDNGMKVKYLSGDAEKAFISKEANDTLYKTYNISFITVPRQSPTLYPKFYQNNSVNKGQSKYKSSPLHSSLGIIDRVIRTIRDMAFNMEIGMITPNIMNEIVRQYNNAPHKTLSNLTGFSVSPEMAQHDEKLEELIIKKVMEKNYRVKQQPGFKIGIGTNVKVYNEKDLMNKRRNVIQPGNHKIIGIKNGLYEVINENGDIQLVPRFKLSL